MDQWNQEQIFNGIKELVSEIKYLERLDDGNIWTSGEDSCIFKGLPPFDYNVEYGEILISENGSNSKNQSIKIKNMYINGVHREIWNWLDERGWYPKWEDVGSLFFNKDRSSRVNLKKWNNLLEKNKGSGFFD